MPTRLMLAIAHIEGFGAAPGNRPTRNNNPGNLNMAAWLAKAPYLAVLEPAVAGAASPPRFARFPTPQQGWDALEFLLLSARYRNLTVATAINKYAPPSENNTTNYVDYVCRKVGCKPEDIVQAVMALG